MQKSKMNKQNPSNFQRIAQALIIIALLLVIGVLAKQLFTDDAPSETTDTEFIPVDTANNAQAVGETDLLLTSDLDDPFAERNNTACSANMLITGSRVPDCSDASLIGADLGNLTLDGVTFQNTDLRGANFSDSVLQGVNFQDADMRDVQLVNADLSSANLSNADLRNANLTGANLTNANLAGANLSLADLTDTVLDNANLTDATMWNATLPDEVSSEE